MRRLRNSQAMDDWQNHRLGSQWSAMPVAVSQTPRTTALQELAAALHLAEEESRREVRARQLGLAADLVG
ncbi:MAG: hypothetical protein ACK56G_15320, partial [Pirellulaceae bacterium]